VLADDRERAQVDVVAPADDGLHRRVLGRHELRWQPPGLAPRVLEAEGDPALVHTEPHGERAARAGREDVHHERERARLAVEVERPVEHHERILPSELEVLEDRGRLEASGIDRLGHMDDLLWMVTLEEREEVA